MAMLSEEEEISVTEKSCWETSSSVESVAKSCLDFTFTTGLQHVLTVTPEMTNPCDIAYIPKRCLFITGSRCNPVIFILPGIFSW